jgi:hypothetical protein
MNSAPVDVKTMRTHRDDVYVDEERAGKTKAKAPKLLMSENKARARGTWRD